VIRLSDGKPWFRRSMGIGFEPITREGRMVVYLMGVWVALFGSLGLAFDQSWTVRPFTGLAIAGAVAGYVVILRKVEGEF
jgi:hypothetical protein